MHDSFKILSAQLKRLNNLFMTTGRKSFGVLNLSSLTKGQTSPVAGGVDTLAAVLKLDPVAPRVERDHTSLSVFVNLFQLRGLFVQEPARVRHELLAGREQSTLF